MTFAEQNSALVPQYLDVAEAQKHFKLTESIAKILKELATLQHGLENTAMLAGGEAYDVALVFYSSVKGSSRSNVPGTQAVHDELKQQFPRRSCKS